MDPKWRLQRCPCHFFGLFLAAAFLVASGHTFGRLQALMLVPFWGPIWDPDGMYIFTRGPFQAIPGRPQTPGVPHGPFLKLVETILKLFCDIFVPLFGPFGVL